jgi:hypothetical protein
MVVTMIEILIFSPVGCPAHRLPEQQIRRSLLRGDLHSHSGQFVANQLRMTASI